MPCCLQVTITAQCRGLLFLKNSRGRVGSSAAGLALLGLPLLFLLRPSVWRVLMLVLTPTFAWQLNTFLSHQNWQHSKSGRPFWHVRQRRACQQRQEGIFDHLDCLIASCCDSSCHLLLFQIFDCVFQITAVQVFKKSS
jgi:hypothetical protein